VTRQYKNIDILIEFNESFAICIEDKCGGTDHESKLRRYIQYLLADGFNNGDIIPVYIQTRDQADYSEIENAGYSIITREHLLNLFNSYITRGGTNDIVIDFFHHLQAIDDEYNQYRTTPIIEWSGSAWCGFYAEIRRRICDGSWGYVPNKSGGFHGFWWYRCSDDQSERYLQLEESKLCFKISVENREDRSRLRSFWKDAVLRQAEAAGLQVIRPTSFGRGKSMTVAVLAYDYRIINQEGFIDLEKTVAVMHEAKQVLLKASESGA